MKFLTAILIGTLAATLAAPAALGQTRPARPALIRDTGTAEGKEEEESKEKVFNPMQAEKSVRIGDFYLKKKNYAAAIERYREAIEYQPNRIEAFEALARAYEKMGEPVKAMDVYREYIESYPDSPKVPDFQSRIAKLEKKS